MPEQACMNLHTNSACTCVRPVLFLSHPDYTVGSGFSPDPPPSMTSCSPGHGLRACRWQSTIYHLNTAGGELHPAPRTKLMKLWCHLHITCCLYTCSVMVKSYHLDDRKSRKLIHTVGITMIQLLCSPFGHQLQNRCQRLSNWS